MRIGPHEQERPTAFEPLRRLLVVVDGRTGARAAIGEAVTLARAHRAALWVAAGPPIGDDGPRVVAAMTREALRAARQAGVLAVEAVCETRPTAASLCRTAAEAGCDLIVVAVAPGSAVGRLVQGSLVPRLITASTVPVLVVPDAVKGSPRRIRRPRRVWPVAAAPVPPARAFQNVFV